MRVVVDPDRCEVNAICMSVAPDVFDVGFDDTVTVLQPEPPETSRADVERAVKLCPRAAIALLDD